MATLREMVEAQIKFNQEETTRLEEEQQARKRAVDVSNAAAIKKLFAEIAGETAIEELSPEYIGQEGFTIYGRAVWQGVRIKFEIYESSSRMDLRFVTTNYVEDALNLFRQDDVWFKYGFTKQVDPRDALVKWLAKVQQSYTTIKDDSKVDTSPSWVWGDKGPVTLYQCEYAIGTDSDGMMVTNNFWTQEFVMGAKDYFCEGYSEKHGAAVSLWMGNLPFPEWLEQRYSSVEQLPYALRWTGEPVGWLKAIIDRQAAPDTGDDGVDWEAVMDARDAQDPQP